MQVVVAPSDGLCRLKERPRSESDGLLWIGGQSTGWYIHIAKNLEPCCYGPWTLEEMVGVVVLRVASRAEGADTFIHFVEE